MTLDQVFKLIDAGYTKQEIAAFENPETPAAPAQDMPEEPEVKDPKPEPEKPAPAEDRYDKILQGITGQLKSLTEAVQLGNIRGAQGTPAKKETTESIIQDMFNVK